MKYHPHNKDQEVVTNKDSIPYINKSILYNIWYLKSILQQPLNLTNIVDCKYPL